MNYLSRSALVALSLISAASAANHSVVVGGQAGTLLKFTPDQVNAEVGDFILFEFQQKNHSATQSSLASPCLPLQDGFDSGFVPVAADVVAGAFPTGVLAIVNTDPYWVYCKQGNHCQQGMVFAVNPGENFAAFQAAATGTASSSAAPSSAATGVVTVTATVTVDNGQVLTTTYGSYPGSSQPTALAAQNHVVVVGGPGLLTYQPSNITAQVGDTITFQFKQKNHTVTQSSFGEPCRQLAQTSTSGQVGFNSGFNPVADGETNFPNFTITVNDTAPIWAYCAQTSHCGSGMVFSANSVESGANTFDAFKAQAIRLNGTGATNGTGNGSGSGDNNAAMALSVGHASGYALATLALVFGLLL